MPGTGTYRVEHHVGRTVTILDDAIVGFPHSSTLAPYVSRVLQQGGSGWLVLVEITTGRRVARRRVRRPERPTPWTRTRQPRGDTRRD